MKHAHDGGRRAGGRRRSFRDRARASGLTGLGAGLLGLACDAAEPRDPGALVRDSAGVRIVESTAPAWGEGEAWRLAERASVVIGKADGAPGEVLHRVTAARKLPGGGFLLANGLIEVRRYDADGRLLWTSGRAGAGPGDFESISALYLMGDSVGVFDSGHARLTVLDGSGAVARVVTLAGVRGGAAAPAGVLPDGSVVLAVPEPTPRALETGRWRRSDALIRASPHDGSLDTLGFYAGEEDFTAVGGGGRLFTAAAFYYARGQAVRGSEIAVAFTERFEILLVEPGAGVRQILRRAADPTPVTDDLIEAWRSARLESLRQSPSPNPGSTERRRLAVEEMTFPPTLPVLGGRLLVDAEANLWVQHAGAPLPMGGTESSAVWSVFDADGRWLGEIHLPEAFRPLDIGPDYVLGVAADALGVESVREYPFATR